MSKYRCANGVDIYYEMQGTGENVFVLIGGLTRDHTIWRKLVPLLITQGQILLFDNRGAGQSSSSCKPYGIQDMAEDTADLMRGVIKDGSRVILIGHSMGGFVAFRLAAKYPALVNGLILCSTVDKQTEAAIAYLRKRIETIDESPSVTMAAEADIRAAMQKIYSAKSLENKAFVDEIITHETSTPYPQSRENFKRQAEACIAHNAVELLSSILCPTLIMTGESDFAYPPAIAQEMAGKIKNAEVSIIPNAGHMIQLENPQAVAESAIAFLAKLRISESKLEKGVSHEAHCN